jgi:hypothetical protein
MTIVTIEIKKDYVLKILEDLKLLDAISVVKQPKEKAKFSAISISTKGFKFDREEINER